MSRPFHRTARPDPLAGPKNATYGVPLDVVWILGIVILAVIVALIAKGVERL